MAEPVPERRWSLLSSHGLVIVVLSMNPDITLRGLSQLVGLTERALHNIITDLASVEMVHIERSGRQNVYRVNPEAHLIHPLFAHLQLEAVLKAFTPRS